MLLGAPIGNCQLVRHIRVLSDFYEFSIDYTPADHLLIDLLSLQHLSQLLFISKPIKRICIPRSYLFSDNLQTGTWPIPIRANLFKQKNTPFNLNGANSIKHVTVNHWSIDYLTLFIIKFKFGLCQSISPK